MHRILDDLKVLLESGRQIPALPTVVRELSAVLNRELAGAAEVAAVIERDPALVTHLLRAANAVVFARMADHRIASVPAAIQRLGLAQVRGLCVGLAIIHAFGPRRGLTRERFWTHSVAVGTVAKLLWARRRGAGRLSPEDLYVAGLLHDVGLLVLDQFFPAEFDRVAAEQVAALDAGPRPLSHVEQRLLGVDHGQIGGALLAHWSLPPMIVEAVRWHHQPEAAPAYREAAWTVAAAEAICAKGWGLLEEGPAEIVPTDALDRLGLPHALLEEVALELDPGAVSRESAAREP